VVTPPRRFFLQSWRSVSKKEKVIITFRPRHLGATLNAAMPKFACPHCGQHIDADDSWCGKNLACPNCGEELIVPSTAEQTVQTAPAEEKVLVPTTRAADAWGLTSIFGSSVLAAVVFYQTTAMTVEAGTPQLVRAGVVLLVLLATATLSLIIASGAAVIGYFLKAKRGVKHVFCKTYAITVLSLAFLQLGATAVGLSRPGLEIVEDQSLAQTWEQAQAVSNKAQLGVSWTSEPLPSFGNRSILLQHPDDWETRVGIRPMVVQRFVVKGPGREWMEVIMKPMPSWVGRLSAPRLKEVFTHSEFRSALMRMGVYQVKFAAVKHQGRNALVVSTLLEEPILGHGGSLELIVFEENAIVGFRVVTLARNASVVEDELRGLWPLFAAVGETMQVHASP